jgi:hypothetical protein
MTENPRDPVEVACRELFCDGVGQIMLVRGMVRLELLVPGTRRGRVEEPPELGARLVMSADGFLRVFEAIDRAATESGLAAPPVVAERGAAPPLNRMARSPNFPHTHDP